MTGRFSQYGQCGGVSLPLGSLEVVVSTSGSILPAFEAWMQTDYVPLLSVNLRRQIALGHSRNAMRCESPPTARQDRRHLMAGELDEVKKCTEETSNVLKNAFKGTSETSPGNFLARPGHAKLRRLCD